MRNWLKNMRLQRKLTQEEVAKICDISRSFYTHIEQGNKTPSVEVAKKIGRTLGFKWTVFFENKCSLKELENKVTA